MQSPLLRAGSPRLVERSAVPTKSKSEALPTSPRLQPLRKERITSSPGSQLRSPHRERADESLPRSPTLERRASLKLDQLLLSDEGAWVAMLNSASPQHAVEIAGPLVRIFAAEGRDTELVKYCIMMEVAAVDAAELFNNASIYSFVVLQACTHHARNYIREVLGPVLADLVHKSHLSFEIDHRYVGTDEVERNLSHLCHVANHIIAALLISVDSLPITLRRIYRFAQVCIEDTYPESAARIPGHLFFTRLLCEALLSPEEFGLVKGKLSENATRAHALLTKILRCVAEETAPSEEALRPLVQWMERAITSVRRFFKLALNVVAGDTLDVHPGLLRLHAIPNPSAKQDRKILMQFVRDNQVQYRWELLLLRAESALHALRRLIPDKGPVSPPRIRTSLDGTESSS